MNWEILSRELELMKNLGVPYLADEIQNAAALARAQAQKIVDGLGDSQLGLSPDSQLVAMVAYLQRLGKDMKGDLYAN